MKSNIFLYCYHEYRYSDSSTSEPGETPARGLSVIAQLY